MDNSISDEELIEHKHSKEKSKIKKKIKIIAETSSEEEDEDDREGNVAKQKLYKKFNAKEEDVINDSKQALRKLRSQSKNLKIDKALTSVGPKKTITSVLPKRGITAN